MSAPREIPGPAWMVDTQGFGMGQYCAAFLLPDPASDELAIVETGPSVTTDNLLDAIDTIGHDPEDVTRILPTHIHLDHAGATWRLLDACPNAEAIIHENGADYVTDPAKVDKLLASVERAVGEDRFPQYGTFEALPEDRVTRVNGDETLTVAGRTLELVDAPGHAPHQYNVHDTEAGVVYVGDAAGIKTPTSEILMTTPPPAFDLDAWHGTLDRLQSLDADTLALTHFGTVPAQEHLQAFREKQDAWVTRIQELYESDASFEDAVKTLMREFDAGRSIYDETMFHHETRMNARGVWLWLQRRG